MSDMKEGLTSARPKLSILPKDALVHGARALEYGADKYKRGNYYGPPPEGVTSVERALGYIDAAMRHLTAVTQALNKVLGMDPQQVSFSHEKEAIALVDDKASGGFPASGLPHLANGLASILIGIECAVMDGLLPADPGQPWAKGRGEDALPQKDGQGPCKGRSDRGPHCNCNMAIAYCDKVLR